MQALLICLASFLINFLLCQWGNFGFFNFFFKNILWNEKKAVPLHAELRAREIGVIQEHFY